MDNKERLEKLLNDIDNLIASGQGLRGYILVTIADDRHVDLVCQGEDSSIFFEGMGRIAEMLEDELNKGGYDED